MIPTIISIDNTFMRDFFILWLMLIDGLAEILIQLNLLNAFKGGIRVAICMVFSFMYFFETIFDICSIFVSLVGNVWVELVILVLVFCLGIVMHYKVHHD